MHGMIAILWMRFGPYHLARLRAAAATLNPLGWQVHGIEVAGNDDIYAWDVVREHDGFERHTLFPEQTYNAIPARKIRQSVLDKLEELGPSAVVINGWGVPEAVAALDWCNRRGATAILASESLPPQNPSIAKELVKSWRVRRFDAALVGGRPHARYVASLGMPAERIFLGYDVVDNVFFEQESNARRRQESELRKRHDLSPRYLYANTRFLSRKNLPSCIRAFALALETDQAHDWHFVITGSGEDGEEIRRTISECGIEDKVYLPGFVQYDELPTYYGLASAFIHPAMSEAWGLVLNEAAACGLPILSSLKVGAAHELLLHGENGLLFDPHSVESMAKAMLDLWSASGEKRRQFGDRSREIASNWGPDRFATGCLEALRCAGALRGIGVAA